MHARELIKSGTASGGMVAKIEACLMALPEVAATELSMAECHMLCLKRSKVKEREQQLPERNEKLAGT